MVGELSSLQLAVESLTGVSALPCMIVEAAVTTIYTSWGGFHTSFITDNIQGMMVFILLIVCTIAMGAKTHIDRDLIDSSGLLKASKLGWQLIYILPVAIATNDVFLSGFWLRTFASRTDRDLFIGCAIATVIILIFLTVTGVAGLLAVWAGYTTPTADNSANAFYLLLVQLPSWVVGFVLVFIVFLSTATFDSFQSSMVSSISNDLFRNRLRLVWVRAIVIITLVPSIVVALKAPNILQIYLISDLISCAVVPSLLLGLWSKMYFLTGWEIVISGLGGILSVFIFGTIYFGNALEGAQLLILEQGLYVDDWSAFGAFVCAPGGGLVFCFLTLGVRLAICWVYSKATGAPFTALDKPAKVVFTDYLPQPTTTYGATDSGSIKAVDDGNSSTEGEPSKHVVEETISTAKPIGGPMGALVDNFFDFDSTTKYGRIKNIFFIPYSEKPK